jgi:hypothetical protein
MTTVATSVKLGTIACRDPQLLRSEAARHGFSIDHWYGKANSFRCPRGPQPGQGWVLLSRKDVLGDREAAADTGLNLTATHSLEFKYGPTTLTIPGLYIRDVRALYADSYNSSNESTYLVELADKRAIFALSTINQWYNTLCPDPPADDDTGAFTSTSLYYANSLNSGALWTWATMLADIWDELPGQGTGDAPSLPYTPDDYPRNFRFIGVSAWEAYNTVLEKIGCVLCYNPITQAFSVVRLNAAQALGAINTDTDLISSHSHQSGVTTYPATIRVFFPRRDEHHGSEKELQQTAGNYRDTAAYSKDIASGITGAVAGTIVPLWDDWPAVYTFAGTHLNQTECDDRAAEVAANYANKLQHCDGPYRRLFYGLKTAVLCGSEIAEIRWGDTGHPQLGMTTEYRGSELVDGPDGGTEDCEPVAESLLPVDVVRQGFPDYPRLTHLVEITGAKTYGLYPAKVVRVDPEQDFSSSTAFTDDVTCYVLPLDGQDLSDGNHALGRVIGTATVSGTPLPLLAVSEASGFISLVQVQPDSGKRYGTVNAYGVFDGKIVTFDPDQSGDIREGDYAAGEACWILPLRHRPEAMVFATYSSSTGAFTLGEVVIQEGTNATGYVFEEDTTGDVLSIHLIEGSAAFATGGAANRTIIGQTSASEAEMDAGSGADVTVPQTTLDEEKVNLLSSFDVWKAKLLGPFDADGNLAERPLYCIDEEPYVRQFEYADTDDFVQDSNEAWPLYFDGAFVGQPGEPLARIYMPCELGAENSSAYVYGIGRHGETGHKGSYGFARWSKSAKRWEMIEGCFKTVALGVAVDEIPAGTRGTVSIWWKILGATYTGVEDSNADVEALNWNTEKIESGSKVIMALDRQENLWVIVYVDRPVMVANDEASAYIEPIGKLTFDTDVGEVYSADFTQQLPFVLTEVATGHVKVQVFGPPSLSVQEATVVVTDPCYELDFNGTHFNVTFVAPHKASVALGGLTWSGDPNSLTNMTFVGGLLTSVT